VLDVPGWPGHLAGQHVDVRLTAEDGYSTQRSYSIAAPADGDRVELTIQAVPDGEVSPYLTEVLSPGDPVELRGPVGGWFVWRPTVAADGLATSDPRSAATRADGAGPGGAAGAERAPAGRAPVLLVGGGSGIVPLMAMVRARRAAGSRVPFRLIYSARTPDDVYYADELRRRVRDDAGLDVTFAYTRAVPDGWPRPPRRIGVADVNTNGWPPALTPDCFVCGPTGFVEAVADILVALGHDPRRVRTERFGPTGG
jgi:ferredoxin-NADP reductase